MNKKLRISLCYYTALATLITHVMIILQHPDHRDSPILFPGNLRGLKIRHNFWERIEAPLPPLRPRPRCNFIHPRQLSPFPERLELPFSNDEILSGSEDIVSSGTLNGSRWTLTRSWYNPMVDVQRASADFREASERRPATSSQTNHANKHFSTRSLVQKRLSIYNRRGKEDAFEKQIAGRWHVITLQEASEYVNNDTLTGRFHVTHYAGCAILFNEETFYSNNDVKSIYVHDTRRDLPDQVMEGEQGWVMQGVLSCASFRRPQSAAR